MHGVLDVGCVVFQAKNEELVFVKNSEPIQKVHSIQTDLEPHLEPKKKAGVTSGVIPQHFSPSMMACVQANPKRLIQANNCLQRMDFKCYACSSPHGGF